jgi:hypothetical protein
MTNASRRWLRRMYLTRHQAQRRASLKAEGARRIEVTLRGASLDHYAVVCRYLGNGGHQRVIKKALDIAAKQLSPRA